MILHLGVIDIPYVDENSTTGDVAEILENEYGVMGTFADLHAQKIADELANSMAGSLENLLMGVHTPLGDEEAAEINLIGSDIDQQPFLGATSKIREQFDDYITTGEIERQGIPGVPTKAALDGKSKRTKSKKGSPRPSFFDSGLYLSSFIAWVD